MGAEFQRGTGSQKPSAPESAAIRNIPAVDVTRSRHLASDGIQDDVTPSTGGLLEAGPPFPDDAYRVFDVGLEEEVAAVEQFNTRVRSIAEECLSAGGPEDLIVLSP